MTQREDQVQTGVRDAWDFWLNEHPISVPDLIHGAVKAGRQRLARRAPRRTRGNHMTTRVVNRRKRAPYDVYIGRPSKWGNPTHRPGRHPRSGLDRYEDWILAQPAPVGTRCPNWPGKLWAAGAHRTLPR